MNIFEIHRRTTSRIEPFHTVYLASCLQDSRELSDQFWTLATAGSPDWHVPSARPRVVSEDVLHDGKRIDVVLIDSESRRLVAIEAKTCDSSTQEGQLDAYLVRLKKKYPGFAIWMTYVTPFNSLNQPEGRRGQQGIREFQRFRQTYQLSSHLSWQEIAALEWHEMDHTWTQHRSFVADSICKAPSETVGWGCLDEDLGWEVLRDFWQAIDTAGFKAREGVVSFTNGGSPGGLADALDLIIIGDKVKTNGKGTRTLADGVKQGFLNSPYSQFHQQVFRLLDKYPFLGIRGTQGYGVTLPIKSALHPLVSVCTSHLRHPEQVTIGRPPGNI